MAKSIIKNWLTGALLISMISGCRTGRVSPDAYGNFESREVIVSAQSQGILTRFGIPEGKEVKEGDLVGQIDSAAIWLKKQQLMAQKSVIRSRLNNIDAQLRVQGEQRINLEREVNRMDNLLKENAATQQQWDDITGKLRVHDSQTEAIRSQKNIISGEQAVLEAQIDELENQLDKCRITTPVSGTVLEKYVDEGELVSPGKALFKVADLNEMELRVYISGSQLSSVSTGDTVIVRIDGPEGSLQSLNGVVSWISSRAEFTPKIIQTREERVNLVYAVKILVRNDGRLKIGMPGEVLWQKKETGDQ